MSGSEVYFYNFAGLVLIFVVPTLVIFVVKLNKTVTALERDRAELSKRVTLLEAQQGKGKK